MAFTASDLIATPGGATANSYVTLAAFTAANESELVADAVADALPDDSARALVMATRRLDAEYYWGMRATDEQALEWPRTGALSRAGVAWADDALPARLARAEILLARHYLIARAADETGDASVRDTSEERLKSMKAGPVEFTWATATSSALGSATTAAGGDLPDDVLRALSDLVLMPGDLAPATVGSFAFHRA